MATTRNPVLEEWWLAFERGLAGEISCWPAPTPPVSPEQVRPRVGEAKARGSSRRSGVASTDGRRRPGSIGSSSTASTGSPRRFARVFRALPALPGHSARSSDPTITGPRNIPTTTTEQEADGGTDQAQRQLVARRRRDRPIERCARAQRRVNTTASRSRMLVGSGGSRRVAGRTTGQPPSDGPGDREPHRGEAIREVALRPRTTARRLPAAFWPRGGNAAHARQ
jgi:hypothetical protein